MIQLSKRFAARVVASVVCATLSVSSFAAPQWCGGTISHSWIDTGGNFYVLPSWRGDHVRLCNINNTLSDTYTSPVTPAVCKGWVAIVLQTVAANKSTTIQYNEAPACNAIPHYHLAPVPNYVMLMS
jgi:hypothetical protein